MKYILVTVCLWLFTHTIYGQPIDNTVKKSIPVPSRSPDVLRINAPEICNNVTDDDNNQLTDQDDFSCYFNPLSMAPCQPSPIIWACTEQGRLYWANLATGVEKSAGNLNTLVWDLSWASNGKLYAVCGLPPQLYEVDPYTGVIAPTNGLPDGYTPGNAMTADGVGNLYLTSTTGGTSITILKLHIATWKICVIASVNNAGYISAGDLTFLNNILYLTCTNNKIITVDVATGKTAEYTVQHSTTNNYFGLTTVGDGYLYAAHLGKIYRIDPSTMKAEISPAFTFSNPGFKMNGLANYSELCQAPACASRVHIQPSSPPPYCVVTGVHLDAVASCNPYTPVYTWTLPSGATSTANKITITDAGKYYLRLQSPPDTCSAIDSFTVTLTTSPTLSLGHDTSLCITEELYITPVDKTAITAYRWQDGSTGERVYADRTGWYWLDAMTGCGPARDSIHVTFKEDGCEKMVFVPSAFSPNGDGLNDVFKPVLQNTLAQYEFSVYNRWGQRVFTTKDNKRGWDGTINGHQQPAGLFAWVCRYRLNRKTVQTLKGTVLLMR
jgi:gliding motility-associated-like protein